MKKIILSIITLLVLINGLFFIGADLTFVPEEVGDIKVSCMDTDSSFCSSTSTCNLTVFYPNMTIFISGVNMTNNVNYFNYTTVSLDQRGEYRGVVSCTDGTNNGYSPIVFTVTDYPEQDQSNVTIVIMISLVAVGFLFLLMGFQFAKSSTLYPVALFLILVTFVDIVYILHLGYVYNRDVLISSVGTSAQWVLYYGIIYSLVGISFIMLLFLAIKTVKEIKERKSLVDYGEGYNPKTKEYDR